jgi:hypothetical protein
MGITGELYMALVHISPIIPSSVFLHVLCKDGVQSKAKDYPLPLLKILNYSRCTARSTHLESDALRSRTREHTNLLVEELDLGILWDEYGLVGNIIVRIFIILFSVVFSVVVLICC